MRLIIVGINFAPELTGIGKYTGEMAAYLSRRGHQVRVITSAPYYPHWNTQTGYSWWKYTQETWSGMQVYRCPVWVPRQPSGFKRILHLLSFAFFSFPVLLAQVAWKPDIILCVAPAFFSAPFALFAAGMSGATTWLHIQDFELDAATSLGILPTGHFLARCAAQAESWLLSRFDRVSTISDRMRRKLTVKGVRGDQTYLFPNWIDTTQICPLSLPQKSLRDMFDLPEDKMIVLYSGSMGNKQGLETVIDVARKLGDDSNILFVFCGDGAARSDLEQLAHGLANVVFLPLQPAENFNQLLNAADIHVLPQKAGAADLVMPSKLLGMLASGKPVIATAEPATEIGSVVGQTGILVAPADVQALYAGILELARSTSLRTHLGKKGRDYACQKWGRENVLGDFETQLQESASILMDRKINGLPAK